MSTLTAVEALLARLRAWWLKRNELAGIDRDEVSRIAAEFGMTAGDLQDLVARGPDAANLLYERMRALGLSREDVDRAALGLMHDLEKTCACCNEKGICEKDLTNRPEDPAWMSYCPNAITLSTLAALKARAPT